MSAYEITVSVTPLCSSCGKELSVGVTESLPNKTDAPFWRDAPYVRKDRRVFIPACNDCFIHRATENHSADAVEMLVEALGKVRSYNVDIAENRINYRPEDHIQVIDEALAAFRSGEKA